MSENFEAQKERLMGDMRVVIADAEALLSAGASDMSEGAVEARGRIKARLSQAKDNLVRLQDAAVEKSKAAGKAADAYVHDHPWRAVGTAAAIGLAVGVLISRR